MDTGPALNLDQLRNGVQAERFDTVLLAFGDAQGRLQGKRIFAQHFLDAVVEHGSEWGDQSLVPDLETMRPLPWQEKSALCLGDLRGADGTPVDTSARQVLLRQLDRLRERGLEAFVATELEFIVFKQTSEEKRPGKHVRVNRAGAGTSLLGAARVEPVLGRLRRDLSTAGVAIDSSGGESISLQSGPALKTADDHVVAKNGAREIALLEEHAITFMAKYDARHGSACRIGVSLHDGEGSVFARDKAFLDRWVGGQRACRRELTLLYAPNVNSYKRPADGSVRVAGQGEALRTELRTGADVNPYLALAGIIASGLHGLDNEVFAYRPQVPSSLGAARELFAASALAREVFGDAVVEQLAADAGAELKAFEAAVTDWERVRGFDRL